MAVGLASRALDYIIGFLWILDCYFGVIEVFFFEYFFAVVLGL
jgi:hypothetical protein